MGEIMADDDARASAAPQGWHPDPSGARQLRWWDGAAWTPHVAPFPGDTAPPNAHAGAFAPAPMGVAPQPRPKGPKIMTGLTWGVLAATVLVVGGGIAALVWGASSASAELASDAPAVLDDFLAATTTGDPSWTEYVTPGLAALSRDPLLYGDVEAAELIELSVDYDAGALMYGTNGYGDFTDPADSDAAVSIVDFTYSFRVDDEVRTATYTSAVWLTRAYYYGDDTPSEYREGAIASAAGPWRVAGVVWPRETDLEGRTPLHETTYVAAVPQQGCFSGTGVLLEMSESSRVDGVIQTACLSGGASTRSDGVDAEVLGRDFPILNESESLDDVMGFAPSGPPGPLTEHRLRIGDADYVFVFASEAVDGKLEHESRVRLIAVQKESAE